MTYGNSVTRTRINDGWGPMVKMKNAGSDVTLPFRVVIIKKGRLEGEEDGVFPQGKSPVEAILYHQSLFPPVATSGLT